MSRDEGGPVGTAAEVDGEDPGEARDAAFGAMCEDCHVASGILSPLTDYDPDDGRGFCAACGRRTFALDPDEDTGDEAGPDFLLVSGEACGHCGRIWSPSMGESYSFPGSACDIGECFRPGDEW